MTAPIPTPPPKAPIYTATTVFGWLIAGAGIALLYIERASLTPWTLGAGLVLVLLGGTCIDRTPVIGFMQAITAGITAWRGKRDP